MSKKLFSQHAKEEADVNEDYSKAAIPLSKTKPDLVNGIPLSGEDYLLVVRQQAKQCAQTVVAERPKNVKKVQLPPHLQMLLQDNTSISTVEHASEVWRKGYGVVFKSYQSYMQKQRNCMPTTRKELNSINEAYSILYSNGENECSITDFAPSLTQHDILRLLKYHCQWLKLHDNIDLKCKWIFSLLVYLDPVLTSSNMTILRELSRECGKLRSELSETHEAPLNTIITIIAVAFGQADLL
ncbi:survival motor neuron interacting protein 1-domain-containing protein [Mycotypha africana]|uniref:survival motor neuron interacting protein 1-domain-containing protein n=1 Tax=Mycotypha africana TaxID=64632 RepID=UPI0023010361|nr:survival motor neuron interacting protein 1-domain-containing protein [Mycotypha africana]KAI8977103.1 survival motor neuron interacting protein 1-domain-containing protein [Mycotypha africana]